MSVSQRLEQKLDQLLQPLYLEIINESHQHAGPATESHFRVVAVSPAFENVSRIQRHRQVNACLAEELQQGIHALALNLYTAAEWEARHGEIPASPRCMGGSKRA
ncbi:MAG: BolA family transcriptional regulator [Candidatus Sericytochromatia bacterium]|nr:BolA family transcriptional regulator [Candidatus Sericytochromatia bacterium]